MSRKPFVLALLSLLALSGNVLSQDVGSASSSSILEDSTGTIAATMERLATIDEIESMAMPIDPSFYAYDHFSGRVETSDDEEEAFYERLKNGDVNITEVPRHLLALQDDGTPISIETVPRHLSAQSANIGNFKPLDCNIHASFSSSSCSTQKVSNILPSSGQPLTIPCGQCFTFDMSGDVTFPHGMNIKGKLLFPPNHKATIRTPYVIVQGELEITVNHSKISPENEATRFILTGTDDVLFSPSDAPNQDACDLFPGSACNLGRKPFVVAGGKVTINTMPETCATFTPVKKQVYTDPVYDPQDFPTFVTLPSTCPTASGWKYITHDFDNSFGNWTGRLGTYTVAADGNTAMRVTNRRIRSRGPSIDITPMRPELCLVPDQEYLFTARLKLDMANGTMSGEDTTCKATKQRCLGFDIIYHDTEHERANRKATLYHHTAPKYGEYFDFTAIITFSEQQLNPDNAYFAMYIHGPDVGIDITIDSFDLSLPSQASYPDPDNLCHELVLNGDAEGNGFNPYPMAHSHWDERLKIAEEDGNKFWRLFERNSHRSSMNYKLDTNCLTRGVTYVMSSRVRYHYSKGFVGGAEPYYWFIRFKRFTDQQWVERTIVQCDAQTVDEGWVTCSGEFMIDEEISETLEATISMGLNNYRDGAKYDLDFDDISIRYSRGYVSELVVDSDDVSCWGDEADIHVTTATYYSNAKEKDNGFLSQIASISDYGDGTANIQLSEAATLPIITEEENPDYAVEIALLSRNVKIEGDDDEENKGGYFQVLKTPETVQTIQGVEFFNMGRRSEVDRYPLQLVYSGELEGTLISRNSFRQSNQRCIAIEGTGNVTVSMNVGYKPNGHCIYIGYQSRYNSITKNLVSGTKHISYLYRIDGETDYHPAAFLNLYNPNDYTDNIAVGGDTYGFQLQNDWRTRLEDNTWLSENIRLIKAGEFANNVAKSNYNHGIRFVHHESGDEIKLSGIKAIKNRYCGLRIYRSYNITVLGALFAENTGYDVDLTWADNIEIMDATFRGITSETKALTKPPYFKEPCVTEHMAPPTGLRLPCNIYEWDKNDNIGAILTNVLFADYDHTDKCSEASPIGVNTQDKRNNHFDYLTMFRNVTVDGSKIMDAQGSVKDIVIHDIDGFTNPSGQISRPGMFVSNIRSLKAFASQTCQNYPNGISYCPDNCYRTISFVVDQESSKTFDLRVTRQSDGEEVLVSHTYIYDDDTHRSHYHENTRRFSVSLPEGSYKAEFISELQQTWPQFVLPTWEGIPLCEGYVSAFNLTLVEPPAVCNEVIVNGDMEQGIYGWLHMSWSHETKNGDLVAVEGKGVDGSTAIGFYNRTSAYHGIGQNLDTRCLHQNLNEFYEIELYVRLENLGTPFICDPFRTSWDVRCPEINFSRRWFEGEKYKSRFTHHHAKFIVPNNIGPFNLMHGVFKIDEELAALDRLFMFMEWVNQDIDIIVDNWSVKILPGICGQNLVRNGDFEENGKFWNGYGTVGYDIKQMNMPTSKAAIVFDKAHQDHGLSQQLYIEKDCFDENDRFKITGKFRIESASDGTSYECDRKAHDGELECSYVIMWTDTDDLGSENIRFGETVAAAENVHNGWSIMSGIMTVTEKQAVHTKMYLRLYGTHTNMNVIYDDISVEPIPKSCQNLILNSGFEVGDSRYWRPTWWWLIEYDISNLGADDSQYSLMIKEYTGQSVRQPLDTRCLIEGQEFVISAKHRLLDSTDLNSGVVCEPSVLNLGDSRHCPTTFIRGNDCDVSGGNVEYTFWNDIDQFEWNPDDFNRYETIFKVGPEIASCKTVYLELGRYDAHNGRYLLIDDIQISQRTTSPPTSSPTFSPTKGKQTGPTSQPTVKTASPTTTNILACPPSGNEPLVLSSGTAMLQHAENILCTLTKSITSESGEITLIPIAQSYDNFPWEEAPGEYANSIFREEKIKCYTAGCQIKLPSLESGEEYLLSSFSYSLSETNEYARFLETATFGTTAEQLEVFESSSNSVEVDITAWISDQMNSTIVPVTSHREFWRKGLNARMPTSTSMGTAGHPCDLHSRWRRISFVRNDNTWSLDKKLRVLGSNPVRLTLNGWTRTVTSSLTIGNEGFEDYKFDPDFDYELCSTPEDRIDGRLYIRLENGDCVWTQNPAVNLDGFENTVSTIFNLPDGSLEPIDQFWSEEELVFKLGIALFDDPSFSSTCSELPSVPDVGDEPIFGKLSDGTWVMFDPRLDLDTNTLNSPIADGGKAAFLASGGDTICSNAPRTFLNDNQCQLSSNACKSNANSQVEILLENSTISALNNLTGRYVYAIEGLLVKYEGIVLEHPCTPGLRSRWELKNVTNCDPTELYDGTNRTLHGLLSGSGDRNPYIRDIHFPNEGSFCNITDTEPEIEIEVNGECWTRVHDEHLSIFDMTYWVDKHPGGPYAIQKWSLNNGTYLIYPSLLEGKVHGMSRWNNNWQKFSYVGRFGDYLRLGDLPNDLRRVEVTDYFDPPEDEEDSNVLICGSPGEISNDKSVGLTFDPNSGFSTLGWDTSHNRKYVWIMIALKARDQLRQKVSWALSQILVVVTGAIGSESRHSEWFINYYDIFVRNAFGNYRDVLKEVSYNPLMAENLSFLGSKSSAYMLERYQVKTSADENFAREIMQLFSMGLVQLNMDGSPKLDVDGYTGLAYTNNDIMSLSRAWTGFDLQPRRSNIEGYYNRLDPMRIVPEWRDRFPKSHTRGGYIGDAYPLCSDFPSKAFLRKGATYRFLGSSSLPELMDDSAIHQTQGAIVKVVLDEASFLRSLLCNEDADGNCVYLNSVTLSTNYVCTGIECAVDTVRVVQLAPDAYYEFVHQPCTSFSFYNNPVKISPRYSTDKVMCADPSLPVASEACCNFGKNTATRNSRYSGERMTLSTAESRCDEESKHVCDFYTIAGDYHLNSGYFWTADSCILQVKIKRDGTIAIVHKPSDFLEQVFHVGSTNENYFRVFWERSGEYPTVDNNCDGVCEVLPEGSCLCNTGIIEKSVFDELPSSVSEAMERLSIGAVDPDAFDVGTYSSVVDPDTGITIHLKNNEFDAETIFEFDDDNGRKFFLKNCKSSVYLRGISSGYTGQSFRNTPQFMSFIPSETTLRDAQYETEAVLDHYLYHPNTPPFLALRLIQRLVTSNPDPRYIQTVAEAFKNGYYESGDSMFGTGEYGDLEATFAAIYLDRAARNVLLDADIASGAIREPILKVLGLMRSMDFVSRSPVTVLSGVMADIGQMAHEFTSVFSFFLPEHKPYGRVADAALVSPEATLLDMPKVVGLMNGLTSMVKYGLSSCEGGWGHRYCREGVYNTSPLGGLEFNKASTDLEFAFETFEGPSLKGGLDNRWVGAYFNYHNGNITRDPLLDNDHVIHFETTSWSGDFFSPPVENLDANNNPYVVKFKYFSSQLRAGGCIGYVDASTTYLNTQTWAYCDDWNMEANGDWISCQFVVPAEVESFRVVVGDRRSPAGDAFFDDIQLASGNESTCTGVDVPKNTPPGQAGYSNAVVDKLSTLLTAGRLSNEAKAIIIDEFDAAGSKEDGLRIAQQLILTTSEFHTTNTVKSTDQPRDAVQFPEPQNKPYRAVVYLLLNGGCDSFNMLAPYTCSNGLYESYLDVRQQVAIPKNRLLPISASNQVCSELGLHPELPAFKSLYDDGDMLFFANTGVMSQPVDKSNYYSLTNTQLFAHNHMQRETKRIDPYDVSSGTGVLGRMTDILGKEGSNIGSFSVDRFSVALIGKPGGSDAPMIVDRRGVPQVYLDDTRASLSKLHNITSPDTGIFAETWSSALMDSIGTNDLLSSELEGLTTQVEFPSNYIGDTLETVSRLIATRDVRGADVDTFYVETFGFDTHSDVEEALNNLFSGINDAIFSFSEEMKALDVWNNVTLIQTSDFARTLNPNGGDGTDHAWGGNYFMMGGSVRGGQILGEYPEDITDDGPLALSRGRMIPTTPWDTVFGGIASWLGIGTAGIDEVCPNLYRFNSSYLLDAEDMFTELLPIASPAPIAPPSTSPSMSPSLSASPSNVKSSSPTSAPVIPTPSPVTNNPNCVDETGLWLIDGSTKLRNWCSWARKLEDLTKSRCSNNNLYGYCPKTCDSCPSVTPAPVRLTPAPTINCDDRTEPWTIGKATRNWCSWARKYGDAETPARCELKRLEVDCPETCERDACASLTPRPTSAPTPAPFVCADRTGSWDNNGRERNWCTWAGKQTDTLDACTRRSLEIDCPVTCGICTPPDESLSSGNNIFGN